MSVDGDEDEGLVVLLNNGGIAEGSVCEGLVFSLGTGEVEGPATLDWSLSPSLLLIVILLLLSSISLYHN